MRNGYNKPKRPKERKVCGQSSPNPSCSYEVTVFYVNPEAVTGGFSPPEHHCPNAGPCNGTVGLSCFGPLVGFCHSFGALFAVTAFVSKMKAEIQRLKDNCLYPVGQWNPYTVSVIKPIPGSGPFGDCESVPDADHPLAGAGPTSSPGCARGPCPDEGFDAANDFQDTFGGG